MNRDSKRINNGIRALSARPYEIVSGSVVEGSLDSEAQTISVRLSDGDTTIAGVMLNAIANAPDGLVLVPEDGSDVIIGSVDGPGEWCLIKAAKLTKISLKIGAVACMIDEHVIRLENGSTIELSDNLVKVSSSTESLYGLLDELLTALTLITVPTPSGVSGTPANATSFTSLQSRLSNLLSA